jgi:transitional endoplasmic reticulum ATPase
MRNLVGFPGPNSANPSASEWGRSPYNDFMGHSSGQRIFTEAVEVNAIRTKHPDRALTVSLSSPICDLLAFAAAGEATAVLSSETSDSIFVRYFTPPARRYGGGEGAMVSEVKFAAYDYTFQGKTFLVYIVHCSRGAYAEYLANFILNEPGSAKVFGEKDPEADALVEAATKWAVESHEEIWIFDRGFWMKDKELYKSVQKSNWDDVILDKEKKESIINDITGFFDSEASYKEFEVPWKVCSSSL